jgi:uncharacterized protein
MDQYQTGIIKLTKSWVKNELANAEGGHDWWHIYRVWKTASKLAVEESANEYIVQIAALLHDIADSKFHNGDETIGQVKSAEFLKQINVDDNIIQEVVCIIKNMSFKNTFDDITYNSIELDVVRDADRLDAIGAIGIARTFNYGGYKGSEIFNPNIKPMTYKSKEEYKNSNAPTINHFYEKLLLLKDMMTTKSGKLMAAKRHDYMHMYLDQFFAEWDGKL